MEINEILRALKDLAHDAEINIDESDPDDIFRRDKAALDAAIEIIERQVCKECSAVPCSKLIREITVRDCLQKVNEELDELKETLVFSNYGIGSIAGKFLDAVGSNRWRIVRVEDEYADVVVALTTLMHALGIDAEMREQALIRANKRNAERERI